MALAADSGQNPPPVTPQRRWRSFFARDSAANDSPVSDSPGSSVENPKGEGKPTKWSMGVLNDKSTHEVPGSVLLLTGQRNEPLGLRNAPARLSSSSLPSPYPTPQKPRPPHPLTDGKKKTKDGAIILEPQPDDSSNDPLNWPAWRRDTALITLGFYCMVGGGMTPILAAGFTNVASTYGVSVPQVALTTGLYMMGLGVGSVVASPTAILFGKRPVYLVSCILFVATSLWCAASPSYASLVVARVLQGMAVSPVECLPSATIAEIFFLHERAYRIGIYTLLLLGGKNIVPLVSAAIIQSKGWRWVFWIVSIVVGFFWFLLFLFVPETFWDRTPRPKNRDPSRNVSAAASIFHRRSSITPHTPATPVRTLATTPTQARDEATDYPEIRRQGTEGSNILSPTPSRPRPARASRSALHVGFAEKETDGIEKSSSQDDDTSARLSSPSKDITQGEALQSSVAEKTDNIPERRERLKDLIIPSRGNEDPSELSAGGSPSTPRLRTFNSPYHNNLEGSNSDRGNSLTSPVGEGPLRPAHYTTILQHAPPRSFVQQLKPWEGRLHHDNWFRVALRPFILFAYPAVLWSSIVYACSVGWLIVLSESVAVIYRDANTYNFSALSAGLIYLSPFIGGVLGTAVAGKVSDIIVLIMSRRNGGLYEPEFRLVMAAPVALTTAIGLMGFGWSAENRDSWIVPTIFFGIISFGCSLGSTTAITFCVDSYRQYAGEALVTLNFSKNIFHGLVFSLFFNSWLQADGSRKVFIALGGIQLALLTLTIPLYIYGKRFRMWTVRQNLMERF